MLSGLRKRPILAAGWLIFFGVSTAALFLILREHPDVVRSRAESVDLLAKAGTADELPAAVGDLGGVFHLRDGAWLAVRYEDRHHGDFWSSAVALDSCGRWYTSTEHHCGSFRGYRRDWDQVLELC